MGGYSSEYTISIESGKAVYNELNKSKFNCYKILILKDRWVYVDNKNNEHKINKQFFSIVLNKQLIKFDCVFNAIHGSPGEDGEIQEYLSKLKIPFTGSGLFQSKITYDKIECLKYLKKHNIKSANSVSLNLEDKIDLNQIVHKVGLPCFVKASKSGSSYGVTKVYKLTEFDQALKVAFKEDENILIESFLDGIEVSVGVISYQNKIICLPITEIISNNDFFDYEAKYNGQSSEITPAKISDEMKSKLLTESLKIFQILSLKGLTRSEFIFKDGIPYLLEVNTVPGLTNKSILPQQVKLAGISLRDLYENLINEALN